MGDQHVSCTPQAWGNPSEAVTVFSKIWGHGSDAHILPRSQLTHKPGCSLGVEIDATLLENSYFNHWGQGDRCSAAPSHGQLPTQTTSPQGSHDWFSLLRQSQLLYPPVPLLHSTCHDCEFISMCITIWLKSAFLTRLYLHEIISVFTQHYIDNTQYKPWKNKNVQ